MSTRLFKHMSNNHQKIINWLKKKKKKNALGIKMFLQKCFYSNKINQ